MKFRAKDLQNIADLARLDLSQEELLLYGEQLSAITNYIEQLKKVSLNNNELVERELKNAWRADEAEPWDLNESAMALEQAEREVGLIKVKRVL